MTVGRADLTGIVIDLEGQDCHQWWPWSGCMDRNADAQAHGKERDGKHIPDAEGAPDQCCYRDSLPVGHLLRGPFRY
jgi:hypothetical protein